MPGGDRTGPFGSGSMSGRGAGFCTGYSMPGYANQAGGRGFLGRCRSGFNGRSRGQRNIYWATGLPGPLRFNTALQPKITKDQEIEFLKNQAKYMQEDIDNVNKRIEELEKPEN